MKYLFAILAVAMLCTTAEAFGGGRSRVVVSSRSNFSGGYCGGGISYGGYRLPPQRQIIILDSFDDGFSRCPPPATLYGGSSFRSFESFRSFGY